VIADIQTVWKLMRSVAGSFKPGDPRYRLLVIADIPAEAFIDDGLLGSSMRPWDVARRGYRLSLATPTTIVQRAEAIATEQQERATKAAGGFAREYRRTHGDGVTVA
jgi:hypothetical protein